MHSFTFSCLIALYMLATTQASKDDTSAFDQRHPAWSSHYQNLSFSHSTCIIPAIIHQTWRNELIEARFVRNIRSWIDLHPRWTYKLWTDADVDALVAARFSLFLETFRALPLPIMRADAMRYVVLYEYGGVYADLDFEALRPFDSVFIGPGAATATATATKTTTTTTITATIMDHPNYPPGRRAVSCLLGQEPLAHAHVLYSVDRLICNAIMASCPGHPFWRVPMQMMYDRFHHPDEKARSEYRSDVIQLTGPRMLSDALADYNSLRDGKIRRSHGSLDSEAFPPVAVAAANVFYPHVDQRVLPQIKQRCQAPQLDAACRSWNQTGHVQACRNRRTACERLQEARHHERNANDDNDNQADDHNQGSSVAVHHWSHTWVSKFARKRQHRHTKEAPCAVPIQAVVDGTWKQLLFAASRGHRGCSS